MEEALIAIAAAIPSFAGGFWAGSATVRRRARSRIDSAGDSAAARYARFKAER